MLKGIVRIRVKGLSKIEGAVVLSLQNYLELISNNTIISSPASNHPNRLLIICL